jgi:hypothetical protein
VDDGPNAGNTQQTEAQGIFFINVQVRTLASLDDIVIVTEIGEGVVITEQAA